jgi:hypothetical protein
MRIIAKARLNTQNLAKLITNDLSLGRFELNSTPLLTGR